jgi:regulator of protease activity HflC (stomatin/prohibitin superfamily)
MLIIAVVVIFFVLPNLIILVGAGQRGVVFNRITGMEKRVLNGGAQFIIPFIQDPTIYNVREISYIFSDKPERSKRGAFIMGGAINTLTSDGQNISVEVTVRARPSFEDLWWLHQNLGNDTYENYVEKIITPVVRSIVREVIAGYTVSAIYSEDRRVVADHISKNLDDVLAKYKIVLTEFLLDEVNFSDAFQNAIEEKQKARIELDTKDNIIIEEMNKKDAVITKAQGEAEAINLRVNSLTANPSFVKYRRAQILGKRTKMIFSNGSL